jgi:hypothetical protein
MAHNPHDPAQDLAAWINYEQDSGDNEVDPYSYVMVGIKTLLEFGLDDGISGAMNETEFNTLEAIAILMNEKDPAIKVGDRMNKHA